MEANSSLNLCLRFSPAVMCLLRDFHTFSAITMTTTKVLIVEDYAPLADTLEYQLQRAGYEVSRAGDGREAVNVAKLTLPDVIILDVDLPSLSGIEVCRLIRSEPSTKDTLILMLSRAGRGIRSAGWVCHGSRRLCGQAC